MIAFVQDPGTLGRVFETASSLGASIDLQTFAENFRGLAMSGDPVLIGVLVVLSLCALGIVWSLLMIVTKGIAALFGGGERESAPSTGLSSGLRGSAMASAVPARARLDEGSRAAPGLDERLSDSRALMTAPLAAPAPEVGGGSRLAAAVGGTMAPGGFGFEGVRALPAPMGTRAVPFRQVALKHKPRLAEVGKTVAARPEWTGKVTPTSLQEAGAVELGHIVTRSDSAAAGDAATARERDFKLFSLPRVDSDGRTQPNLTIFSVSDHGILPRGTKWPSPKGFKRD